MKAKKPDYEQEIEKLMGEHSLLVEELRFKQFKHEVDTFRDHVKKWRPSDMAELEENKTIIELIRVEGKGGSFIMRNKPVSDVLESMRQLKPIVRPILS